MAGSELSALAGLPLAELRRRRNEVQQTEQTLSYLRRLVQGRLDIVLDEQQRRRDGAGARDLAHLVDDLPGILAEHTTGGGRGALPGLDLPEEDEGAFVADLDRIVDASRLGDLGECSDDELRAIVDALNSLEQRVSAHRRNLHNAIDGFQSEIVQRYKSGEASVDALLP